MTTFNPDQLIESIENDISAFGWSVVWIDETDYLPSLAYSVGLWSEYNHPEIVCFGLDIETLTLMIHVVAEKVKQGLVIQTQQTYTDFFEHNPVHFLSVDNNYLKDYFGIAITYYGDKVFQALQMVWPDQEKHFPWESQFDDNLIYFQPLLDRNLDFKFREPKDLLVSVSANILTSHEPIIKVIHDTEGDWHFISQVSDTPLVTTTLMQILQLDSEINELFDLGYGEMAERTTPYAFWIRSKPQKKRK